MTNNSTVSIFSLGCIFLVLFPSLSFAEANWPRFRGPNGSGVDASADLPVKWTDQNLAWKTEIPGKGHGSPIIWSDQIFLLTSVKAAPASGAENDRNEKAKSSEGNKRTRRGKGKGKGAPATPYQWMALAVSRNSGEILWTKSFPVRRFKGHRFNSPASSTAAADAQQVVFCWGTSEELTVVSLSHQGSLHWQRDMGPVKGGHGFAASPILHEGLVIVNNDQENQEGNLFALHAETGETAWTVPRKSQRISYSAPCLYRDKLVFVNWQHGFTAIDPKNGTVISEKSVFDTSTNERAISSPIVAGELVIGTCGFTANPKHCVAMELNGDSWREAWRIERNVPHIPSVLAIGNLIYLWDDSGILTCARTSTGEQLWKERIPNVQGKCFGSPVSDGKHLFCADESGNIHVVAAGESFQYITSNALGEPCKTTPAIADGNLYIRTETTLHALKP